MEWVWVPACWQNGRLVLLSRKMLLISSGLLQVLVEHAVDHRKIKALKFPKTSSPETEGRGAPFSALRAIEQFKMLVK